MNVWPSPLVTTNQIEGRQNLTETERNRDKSRENKEPDVGTNTKTHDRDGDGDRQALLRVLGQTASFCPRRLLAMARDLVETRMSLLAGLRHLQLREISQRGAETQVVTRSWRWTSRFAGFEPRPQARRTGGSRTNKHFDSQARTRTTDTDKGLTRTHTRTHALISVFLFTPPISFSFFFFSLFSFFFLSLSLSFLAPTLSLRLSLSLSVSCLEKHHYRKPKWLPHRTRKSNREKNKSGNTKRRRQKLENKNSWDNQQWKTYWKRQKVSVSRTFCNFCLEV